MSNTVTDVTCIDSNQNSVQHLHGKDGISTKKPLFSLVPSQVEMEQAVSICKVLATCPYYQKMGAGGVLAIWLTAREMGLPPMLCLNGGMYTFSGAVTLSSQLMNMLIVNAGHQVDILECSDTAAEVQITRGDRKGDPNYKPFVYRYTMENANKAGLTGKHNWKTNPRDMLFSRALSGAARKHTPEAIMTAYAHGELDDKDTPTDKSHAAVREEAAPVEIISSEQAKDLTTVLLECNEEYQAKVHTFLQKGGIESVFSLPVSMFDRVMSAALKKRSEAMAAKAIEVEAEEPIAMEA